jgi:hypothetical protein
MNPLISSPVGLLSTSYWGTTGFSEGSGKFRRKVSDEIEIVVRNMLAE